MSSFFCLWMPQFPAWVMAQSEPGLAQRPFVVCEKGQVVAISPLALAAGVKSGMSSGRAQSLCTSVQIIARDRSREALAWEEVQRVFYGLTPKIEAISPGLLFADVDGRKTEPLLAAWNVYGGCGEDRASAHLAALTVDVGGAWRIRRGREASFADRVPLEALVACGLSSKSLQRLHWFGYQSVGAVRILTRRQLEEQFAPDGEMLFRLSQGPKCKDNLRPVPSWMPPDELTAHLSFDLPCREPAEWEPALDLLLRRVCQELGSRSAQSMEVVAQTAVNPVASRRILKEPINQPRMLEQPARAALAQALESLHPLPPVVTGLEVRLSALTCAPVQASLWEEAATSSDPATRTSRWRRALENVESRFKKPDGEPIMGRFVRQETHSPFPEDQFGWLPALEEINRQNELKTAASVKTARPRKVAR